MDILLAPITFIDKIYQTNIEVISDQVKKKGFKYSKKCHCIIGSLVRDSSKAFKDGVKKVKDFSKIFKTVDVIIIENDSLDNTRKLWEDYSKKCPKNVKIFVEYPKIGKYPKTIQQDTCRIKKMVKLRNNLITIIKEKSRKFDYDTFIFLTDLDIKGELEVNGIYDTFYKFKRRKKYDAIGCNGLMYNLFYFDGYAYKNSGKDKPLHPTLEVPINQGLFTVSSSFSGGVFYRYNKIINLKYKLKKDKDGVICEHVPFHKQLTIAINTNMKYNIYSH